MAQPRVILFDVIDTLLHVEPEHEPYWITIGEELARAQLCDATEFSLQYAQLRAECHNSDIEVPLQERLGRLVALPSELGEAIERQWLLEYRSRTNVIDGVNEMLDAWRSEATLGVVSNFFISDAPSRLLEHHGLLDYFSFVVVSAGVGYRKPNSKIFERALVLAETADPRDVLMVGDNPHADVAGALSFGIRAAHYSTEEGADGAHWIRSWNEFRPAVA